VGIYSFEVAVNTVNNRDDPDTIVIATGTANNYLQTLDAGTYYAWVRGIQAGKVGNWVPASPTAGVSGMPQDDLSALLALVTP
jgi:hypothetical protein